MRPPDFRFLLFIDDDPPTNVFHEIVLKETRVCERYEFRTSSTEALAYVRDLKDSATDHLPEVIFLDLNMPGLDGWQFVRELGALNWNKYPAIILLSTSRRMKDIQRSEMIPLIHSYLTKPLTTTDLIGLAKELSDAR